RLCLHEEGRDDDQEADAPRQEKHPLRETHRTTSSVTGIACRHGNDTERRAARRKNKQGLPFGSPCHSGARRFVAPHAVVGMTFAPLCSLKIFSISLVSSLEWGTTPRATPPARRISS